MIGYTKLGDAMSHNRLYGIDSWVDVVDRNRTRFYMKLGSNSCSQLVFSDPWGEEIHSLTYERNREWLISEMKKEKGV
jgi:hypothetical protein